MATPVPRLTISPFLQRWDPGAGRLDISVLLVPTGDPRQPLGIPTAPAFSGSTIVLEARYPGDPLTLPTLADIAGPATGLPLAMPAMQSPLFDALAAKFKLKLAEPGFQRSADLTLRKYLPQSYRRSFGFVAPRTPLAVIDDSYHCAIRCPPTTRPPITPPGTDMSWGEAHAALLRQPAAARTAGLVHDLSLDVGGAFTEGGWLVLTLAAGSDFAAEAGADPSYLRLYATRVPRLDPAAAGRPVFTPVLFPVYANAASVPPGPPIDPIIAEAIAFDDGFAKIVHARQPRTTDNIAEDDEPGLPPQREEGVQFAWDDEDLLVSQNRTVGLEADGSIPPDAPRSVFGYRIDLREAGGAAWTSLCRVKASGIGIDAATLPDFETELTVEVHPTRALDRFWLPPYYLRWRGGSMVADSADERLLAGRPDDAPSPLVPVNADAVPLRYGRSYEFRVRLADTTGGGPGPAEASANPAAAPIAQLTMRRYVPPAALGVAVQDGAPPAGAEIRRPLIGWPAAVLADIPDATARLATIARDVVSAALTAEVGLPDPDATQVEATILVRMPEFDPTAGPGGWTIFYTTTRDFPGDPELPLSLMLEWRDCAGLTDIAWPTPAGPLRLPTARDVRVELRALGRADPGYFGTEAARRGPRSFLGESVLHVAATVEGPVFAPTDPVEALAAVLLQPDPPAKAATVTAVAQGSDVSVLARRLAAAIDLPIDMDTLFGPPGRRVVFACTGLQHRLAPDSSSLALTAAAELSRRWINVLRVRVMRDWSWLGSDQPAFRLERSLQTLPGGPVETTELGSVTPLHAVNRQATLGEPDRDSFDLVLVDAFPPPLRSGLPHEVAVTYRLTARLADGTTELLTVVNRLPVATPPIQRPAIVSAGHAFADYAILGDYAATAQRDRALWIELAAPLTDVRDALFCRVLHVAPDPLLMPQAEPLADPTEPVPPAIIPAPVRVIRPGQPDDAAGLSAMQRLLPSADSERHFLVPLPPNLGAEAAELFGFFTYEFAVGHDRGTPASPFWSTAEGRYGPPLVLAGVQHPPPPLLTSLARRPPGLRASAEPARAFHQGRQRTRRPRTEIWMVLYARVRQADDRATRNIQIDARKALSPPGLIGLRLETGWSDNEIALLLRRLALPAATPLSLVAAEVLPEPNGAFGDPLGNDLGQVRILRTSPLTEVPTGCC